jgi:hypothetical protein
LCDPNYYNTVEAEFIVVEEADDEEKMTDSMGVFA